MLRCNRCDKPICYDCAVRTPVGYRCKECVRASSKVLQCEAHSILFIGAVIGFILGALAGRSLFCFFAPSGCWASLSPLFAGPAAGGIIAEAGALECETPARPSPERRRDRARPWPVCFSPVCFCSDRSDSRAVGGLLPVLLFAVAWPEHDLRALQMSMSRNSTPGRGKARRPAQIRVGTFASLRFPNFRLWFSGQTLSLMGTWMQSVAQGWLVYQLTGSELALGAVSFIGTIPTLFLMLPAGAVVDRVSRRSCCWSRRP